MLDQIRASLNHLLGYDEIAREHALLHAELSELERRQLEIAALTEVLDGRVTTLEGEHADVDVA
jgi:hypothetical protein